MPPIPDPFWGFSGEKSVALVSFSVQTLTPLLCLPQAEKIFISLPSSKNLLTLNVAFFPIHSVIVFCTLKKIHDGHLGGVCGGNRQKFNLPCSKRSLDCQLPQGSRAQQTHHELLSPSPEKAESCLELVSGMYTAIESKDTIFVLGISGVRLVLFKLGSLEP